MRAGTVVVAAGLAVVTSSLCLCGCAPDDQRVAWRHDPSTGAAPPGVATVRPGPARPTGLRQALAHVRASPATRTGFAYGAALAAPVDARTDLTPYGYGELGEVGRHLGGPLGFSVARARAAFTAGDGSPPSAPPAHAPAPSPASPSPPPPSSRSAAAPRPVRTR
ncbi:MAG TPA: hypothetical protein VGL93_06210 [Streptosporangiaceae bacterium]|jgi:hypothetical protein